MVKKISNTRENRKDNILDRFKPLKMPNGKLAFLLTQSSLSKFKISVKCSSSRDVSPIIGVKV